MDLLQLVSNRMYSNFWAFLRSAKFLFRYCFWGFSGFLFLASCGDEPKEIYELTKIRVPVAQFFQETSADEARGRTGCTKLSSSADGKTFCQQFPLRFGKTFKLRFVAISPEGTRAAFAITQLQRLSAASGASSFAAAAALKKVPLTELKIVKDEALSFVLQEKPMRIEQIVYTLSTPLLDATLAQREGLPSYEISYNAKGTSKNLAESSAEQGFFGFYILPDAKDKETWEQLKLRATQAGLQPGVVENAQARAKSNIPPSIAAITPKSGSKAGKGTYLEINLQNSDTDTGARSRVQWYTTSGKLGNQRAKRTSWDIASGPVGAFVVVRDLQGGLDFAYTNLK